MHHCENKNIRTLYFIEDDMTSVFMPSDAITKHRRWASHARIVCKQPEAVFHIILVASGLIQSELFDAVEEYIEDFAFGPYRQPIAIHR